MLAHVPSFGRNPGGSPDFLAYPVPKACMHALGTRVPRCLGVARSASSPKAAQALPTRNPNHVYTPSTEHSTGTAHTGTTGTAHTPTSMRAPPAPIPPRRRPSTGTTNRQPPHVHSAFASGYHRQPCPATQTTGSAWEPRTASGTAPTAGTSTPTTASGPQPQPHPPPPATPASSGSSPTPSGTTWEGTTWRTRRTTHGP